MFSPSELRRQSAHSKKAQSWQWGCQIAVKNIYIQLRRSIVSWYWILKTKNNSHIELTMTRCYLSSVTWIRLFVHAIHVGAYWGFRTPALSKTEQFVTIVTTFLKKAFKKFAEKKMNMATDRSRWINIIKILQGCHPHSK